MKENTSGFRGEPYLHGKIVVDGASGKIGKVVGEAPAKDHPAYRLVLLQLADGSEGRFFPERIRLADQEETERFERSGRDLT